MTVAEYAHVENLQRSLGRRIRAMRSKRGWTQEQFAEFCGLHRTYMGHVERGEKNVSLSTVLRVANALGVRISALFSRPQDGPAIGVAEPAAKSARPGLNRLDVSRLVDELQHQRQALLQAVRDLSRCVRRLGDSTS